MSTEPPAIETRGVTKHYGERVAIEHIDLVVPAGTAFGFLGPNGAGKTTLIRTLLGLTRASSGEMRMLGRPVPEQRASVLGRVGAIIEEPRFHEHLTGPQNLWLIAAARGDEAVERIPSVLERVGLEDRAEDRVRTYSLGMRQRLGLARCLLSSMSRPTASTRAESRSSARPSGRSSSKTVGPCSCPRTCSARSSGSATTPRSSIAAA
jgi:ABC-2 type transport system ATP-binding protein